MISYSERMRLLMMLFILVLILTTTRLSYAATEVKGNTARLLCVNY